MKKEPVLLVGLAGYLATLAASRGFDLDSDTILAALSALVPIVLGVIRHFVTPEQKAKQREVVAAHRAQTATRVKP